MVRVRTDAGLAAGNALLAQNLDQLARLLDTPVFAGVRLRLLDPSAAAPLRASLEAPFQPTPQPRSPEP